MNIANLQLKHEWIENDKILAYTLYSLNLDTMRVWSLDVLNYVSQWKHNDQILLLFDLSAPNVGMSYFVLTGRDLFKLSMVPQNKADFDQFFRKNPKITVKVALVLSRTMGSLLSARFLSTRDHRALIGKAFFDRNDAVSWLLIEEGVERDVITQGVNIDEVLDSLALDDNVADVYGDQTELRLLVNGSLEIVPITETKSVIIGRSKYADLDVTSHGKPAQTVSRRHVQISLVNQRLFVIDLGSKNGSYLSERFLEPGKPVMIRRDDVVRMGGISISVMF